MNESTITIDGGAGSLECHVRGDGPAVVLLPSLGRGASDFDDLSVRLAEAGHRVIRPEPRGIGGSALGPDAITMEDLADDVARVIRTLVPEKQWGMTTVVGHAFGNRVTRMLATIHPELVDSVVLLACGGFVHPRPEIAAALAAVFDTTLDEQAHLDAVRTVFFAPGNDATVWADGWYPRTAGVQTTATKTTSVDSWWSAGRADVLVVQPADDAIAVPENAVRLVEVIGDRARMVTIANAGHALLPEQPEIVAATVLSWIRERMSRNTDGQNQSSA